MSTGTGSAARTALSELRELVHGIHPPVLTNRGLAPAVTELVETAAWFIIGEALTNVAKHSHATRAWVHSHQHGSAVILEVGDNGVGGANPDNGTGLLGLTDRVSVLHGLRSRKSLRAAPSSTRMSCASSSAVAGCRAPWSDSRQGNVKSSR